MKKLLFSALVAVVAVGGALSSNAEVVTGVPSGIVYNCAIQGTLCQNIPGSIQPADPTEPVQLASTYFAGKNLRFN